jgi:hypothetical protein
LEYWHYANTGPIPDLGVLVAYAQRIPPAVLCSIPEVERLIELTPRHSELGYFGFVKSVLDTCPQDVLMYDFNEALCMQAFARTLNHRVQEGLVTGAQARPTPSWDSASRRLYFGDTLCLEYNRPAPNQELVLNAFQEQDWIQRIDDPLSPGRLADTISDLQEKLRGKALIIERDGSGRGITWRPRTAGILP